jgi:hypothetical protein
MRKLALAFTLLALAPTAVQAHFVYPGCVNPPTNPTGKLWYFDPVNGKTATDWAAYFVGNPTDTGAAGDRAHPFKDLGYAFQRGQNGWLAGYPHQALVSTAFFDHYPNKGVHGQRADEDWNPASPNPSRINPGDGILLESGSYGDLNVGPISGAMTGVYNVDAKGATKPIWISNDGASVPMFTTIAVANARGFIFQRLNVESTLTQGASNSASLVRIAGNVSVPTQDIIFETMSVGDWGTTRGATQGGMPAWTQADWRANYRVGVDIVGSPTSNGSAEPVGGTTCISFASSQIKWVNRGVGIGMASKIEVDNNQIHHFAGDGIDIYSSFATNAVGNNIHDRFDAGDGDHPDAVQLGFTGVHGTWEDVHVQSNRIEQLTDPAIGTVVTDPVLGRVQTPPRGDLQGINATNENWDRLWVLDNRLVIQACLALNFGSATNSLIANNSAVWAGGPGESCQPWLSVGNPTTPNNRDIVANNFITGAVHRGSCTDGGYWVKNYVAREIAAGVPQKTLASSVCHTDGVTWSQYVGAGVFEGVTIDDTTPLSGIVQGYNPPASTLSSATTPNLTPTIGGPLDGTGAIVPGGPTAGMNSAWLHTPTPNIGAY